MRRRSNITFRLITAFVFLCSGFVIAAIAQATPTPEPTLPPGMVGSSTSDPRANLSPGLYDAGERSLGMRHVLLLKKPDSFQLGTDNPDDPKVQKMLTVFGIADTSKIRTPRKRSFCAAGRFGPVCSGGRGGLGAKPCVPQSSRPFAASTDINIRFL